MRTSAVDHRPINPSSLLDQSKSSRVFHWIGVATTVAVVAIVAFKSCQGLDYWQNYETKQIECRTKSEKTIDFSFYNNPENQASARDQYCLAKAFENGEGVEQSPTMARYWYKKAVDQGLLLAQNALCKGNLFEDVPSSARLPEFEAICCPSSMPILCPWHDGNR